MERGRPLTYNKINDSTRCILTPRIVIWSINNGC